MHLRNVVREDNGSFYADENLDCDNDMVSLLMDYLMRKNA